MFATICSEAAGHLLTVFALSQVAFTHVIVKGDVKIPEEEKVVSLVFLQPVQEGFLILHRPSKFGWVLFPFIQRL